jgi:hypothetical protein
MIKQMNFFALSSSGDDNTKISSHYSLPEESGRFLKYAGEIIYTENSNIIILSLFIPVVYLYMYFNYIQLSKIQLL